ncbi:hypothetical protein [Burkholderia cepacia]|uniref:hypothetical protein n=1 Tax=Burkholderia cepacia TaxID=292 RepID=UPI0011D1B78A|nr:hypothetical protein [Burkholderia cepacia]
MEISQKGSGSDLSFEISLDLEAKRIPWRKFFATMATLLEDAERLDVDITMLCCETIFHVVKYAISAGIPVTYHYVTPASYSFSQDPFQLHDRSDICQLPGFVARVPETEGQKVHHVIALGFDGGRAQKFIERYSWRAEDTIALVVDPEFVPEGRAQALAAARPWLDEFKTINPKVLQSVAVKPSAIARVLARTLRDCKQLDLVLLGPKPLMLGAAMFCNWLDDLERLHVRVLTDFAVPTAARSSGIGSCFSIGQAEILEALTRCAPQLGPRNAL